MRVERAGTALREHELEAMRKRGTAISLSAFWECLDEEGRPHRITVNKWAERRLLPSAHKVGPIWVVYPAMMEGWRFPKLGRPPKGGERDG